MGGGRSAVGPAKKRGAGLNPLMIPSGTMVMRLMLRRRLTRTDGDDDGENVTRSILYS